MKLFLQNHDYKYAAEQMLLTLFPQEHTEYAHRAEEAQVVLSLTRGASRTVATARLRLGGRTYRKTAWVTGDQLTGRQETDRALQKILKLAFYRAGVEALGAEPPWGALTGVRPAKIPTRALQQGATPVEAVRQLMGTYRVSQDRAELAVTCAQAALAAMETLHPGEISLYVGIPFCPTRCTYCSFVSADVQKSGPLVAPFLAALASEIQAAGDLLRRRGLFVRSVYIGGGTPTALSAGQLDVVMSQISSSIDLSHCTEYTVEAGRPDTITAEKLSVIVKNGGDRVSVNPQTMEDAVLAAMGRNHTAAQSLEAYRLARASGVSAINMDLIAGLPLDSTVGFCRSLDQVLDLDPENVTVHTLALKKGSALLVGGGQNLPSAQEVAAMLAYAGKVLPQRGYRPYYLYRQKFMSGSFENVGWCKPGFSSLYNICMMEELHSILALGGGGVTKLVSPATGHIDRRANPKYPKEYLEHIEKLIAQKEDYVWPIS